MSFANPQLIYAGQAQLTTLSSSIGLGTTPSVNGRKADTVMLRARTNNVYVRLDGSAATSADMLIPKDIIVTLCLAGSDPLANIRVLESAASAQLDVWFFASGG